MGIRDLEFAYPTDDLSRTTLATLASGTQAAGYGPERLMNDDPSYPFKVDSTTFRLVWDFGSAVPIAYFLLVHHNFFPGLTGVTAGAGTSSATTEFQREFTIRDYGEDAFPQNEALDVRDDALSYRYASLEVTSANTVNCAVGKFAILTTVRSLDGTLMIDAEDDESHPIVEHKTDVGVSTIYAHGTRLRWLRGDKIQVESDAAQIRAWNRASGGRALPFVLIPHIDLDDNATASPPIVLEESWLVRWEKQNLPRTYIGADLLSRYRLEFEECGRGLRPTPAAI